MSTTEVMSGRRRHLQEVGRMCFKLGCIAFGGPVAHIAFVRAEVGGRYNSTGVDSPEGRA